MMFVAIAFFSFCRPSQVLISAVFHLGRNYIALAKTYQPYISPELTESIAARYAKMREDAEQVSGGY